MKVFIARTHLVVTSCTFSYLASDHSAIERNEVHVFWRCAWWMQAWLWTQPPQHLSELLDFVSYRVESTNPLHNLPDELGRERNWGPEKSEYDGFFFPKWRCWPFKAVNCMQLRSVLSAVLSRFHWIEVSSSLQPPIFVSSANIQQNYWRTRETSFAIVFFKI